MATPAKQSNAYAIPVSHGLIDPQHRKKMGSAIWLFLLLLDWETDRDEPGEVRYGKPIKIREMMQPLDLQEKQVRNQLQRLKIGGYIRLKRTQYGYIVVILNPKKWGFRDRYKITDLEISDRQEITDLSGQTGNLLPLRSVKSYRNINRPEDIKTEEGDMESDKPIPDSSSSAIKKRKLARPAVASEFQPIIDRVVAKLNELTGSSYRSDSKAVAHIAARLKEGFSETDLIAVVEDRCRRWLGDSKMSEYLRPATLFNSEKFDGYLQAARSVNGNNGHAKPEVKYTQTGPDAFDVEIDGHKRTVDGRTLKNRYGISATPLH